MSSISTDSYSNIEDDKYYMTGGYCRINVGDVFNQRYRTVYMLGWGGHSMVWLVWDYKDITFRAMKAIRCSDSATEDAKDEIEINSLIDDHSYICRLIDSFDGSSNNDTTHIFLVFACLGVGLDFIAHHHGRLSISTVELIVKNLLSAIKHLKEKSIIHTDIKIDNILVSNVPNHIHRIMTSYKPPPIDTVISTKFVKGEISYVPYMDEDIVAVKMADFGSARLEEDAGSFNVQPDDMQAPEIIVGYPYDQAIDIWSIGCIAYELLTGDRLFDCAGDVSDRSDSSSISTDTIGCRENRLACMEELLGPLPKYIIEEGIYSSRYIDLETCKYKHIDNLIPESLHDKLKDLDLWTNDEVDRMCSLLLPLLALDPKKRLQCIE